MVLNHMGRVVKNTQILSGTIQGLRSNETRSFCQFNRNKGNDGDVYLTYFMTKLYCIAQ
jgi:hypothetical protein